MKKATKEVVQEEAPPQLGPQSKQEVAKALQAE